MLNRITLIGRLGKDPEVRTFDGGISLVRLTLATNESYKDQSGNWQEHTHWHDLIFWREQAERAERQLRKGALVYVEGKLQYREWTDEEGKKRRIAEIVVNYFRNVIANREQEGAEQGDSKDKTPMPVQDPDDNLPF